MKKSIATKLIAAFALLLFANSPNSFSQSAVKAYKYESVPNMTMTDIKSFEQTHLKDKKYTVLVVGKKESLDMKTLEKYGKVTFLTLQDIFGY